MIYTPATKYKSLKCGDTTLAQQQLSNLREKSGIFHMVYCFMMDQIVYHLRNEE